MSQFGAIPLIFINNFIFNSISKVIILPNKNKIGLVSFETRMSPKHSTYKTINDATSTMKCRFLITFQVLKDLFLEEKKKILPIFVLEKLSEKNMIF